MTVKKAILVILCSTFGLSFQLHAQSGISLYHLGNTTFQSSHMNPSYLPDAKFQLGLPLISGIMLDVNSPYSYSDAFSINETGDNELDVSNMVDKSSQKTYFSLESEISTFYLGFKTNSSTGFSLFIRERIAARGFYSREVVDFAWNGNSNYVGQTLDLSSTVADARYYREYGFGLWKEIPKQKLQVGVRVKFLNGMLSAISDQDFSGEVHVDDNNFAHTINISNARMNTTGVDLLENGSNGEIESYFTSNSNIGFGIDLGMNWRINQYVSVAASINDLGYINWKDGVKNYGVSDTTFVFSGLDLKEVEEIEQAIEDSLINRFEDSVTYESYRSGLNTSAFVSGTYHLTENDRFTATVAPHIVQGNWRMLYAVGYTRQVGNFLSVSANAIRKPQQGIDFGLATAFTAGGLQLYLASDQLIKVWDVPNAKSMDIRFGINFIVGRNKVKKDELKDLEHPWPYTNKSKMEKSDGIYWIIPKQKPRPVYNDDPSFSDK